MTETPSIQPSTAKRKSEPQNSPPMTSHNSANEAENTKAPIPDFLKTVGGDVPETCPLTGIKLGPPFPQVWSPSGYPIVDGKYFDGRTGKVVTLGPDEKSTMAGPPQLEVYWHNRCLTGEPDHFIGMVTGSMLSMTEYVVRVGELLKKGACTLQSLTATRYTVNVIVFTELSHTEMDGLFRECKLDE